MIDVRGARDYLAGRDHRPCRRSACGRTARTSRWSWSGRAPTSRRSSRRRSSPSCRRRRGATGRTPSAIGAVVSGGYAVAAVERRGDHARSATSGTGPARRPIPTVRLILDIGGRSPVAAFLDDDLDYTEVSIVDAPWIAYDERARAAAARDAVAGAHLHGRRHRPRRRSTTSGSARRSAPRSTGAGSRRSRRSAARCRRRAWCRRRIPGAGDKDWLPLHDPDRARALLAEAGYPGRRGAAADPVRGRRRGDRGRHRRGPRARARDGRRARDPRRPPRPHLDRPAEPLDQRLDRGLPRPERLPRRAPRERQHGEQGRLGLAGVRPGDRRRARDPRSGRGRGGVRAGARRDPATRCRSCRCTSARTGRCRATGCSARAATAWASCAWRAWRGRE